MEEIKMTVEADPNPSDIQTVEQGLRVYGDAIVKLTDMKGLNIFLRDNNNQIIGGLLGLTKRGWLEIGTLWVREDMRGKGCGTKMVLTAEQEARSRGCHHSYVNTFSWEAPDFYQKLGYEIFSTLEGYSGQHKRYHFQKCL